MGGLPELTNLGYYKSALANSKLDKQTAATIVGPDEKGVDHTAAQNPDKKRVIVIDAMAVWCGPCKQMAPVVAKLAEEFSETVFFAQIDVDEVPDVAQELGISAMPTFKIMKDGELYETIKGAYPSQLKDAIAKTVATLDA